MSGHHPYSGLTKEFTPELRKRIDALKNELLVEMPLHELLRVRALTQRGLAEILKVNQPTVAKLEHRADVYVSLVLHPSPLVKFHPDCRHGTRWPCNEPPCSTTWFREG